MAEIHCLALLGDYADHLLTASKRRWVEEHLAACPACRRELALWEAQRETLASLGATTAPPSLRAAVRAGVEKEIAAQSGSARRGAGLPAARPWWRGSGWSWGAGFAATAAGLLIWLNASTVPINLNPAPMPRSSAPTSSAPAPSSARQELVAPIAKSTAIRPVPEQNHSLSGRPTEATLPPDTAAIPRIVTSPDHVAAFPAVPSNSFDAVAAPAAPGAQTLSQPAPPSPAALAKELAPMTVAAPPPPGVPHSIPLSLGIIAPETAAPRDLPTTLTIQLVPLPIPPANEEPPAGRNQEATDAIGGFRAGGMAQSQNGMRAQGAPDGDANSVASSGAGGANSAASPPASAGIGPASPTLGAGGSNTFGGAMSAAHAPEIPARPGPLAIPNRFRSNLHAYAAAPNYSPIPPRLTTSQAVPAPNPGPMPAPALQSAIQPFSPGAPVRQTLASPPLNPVVPSNAGPAGGLPPTMDGHLELILTPSQPVPGAHLYLEPPPGDSIVGLVPGTAFWTGDLPGGTAWRLALNCVGTSPGFLVVRVEQNQGHGQSVTVATNQVAWPTGP